MPKFVIIIMLSIFCFDSTANTKFDSLKYQAKKATYRLVKTDSILVNKLSIIQITDYNPKTKTYLAYGLNDKACMELDENGKILKEVDLRGEGPGHFGQGMSAMGYVGGTKVIEGGASYIFYNQDWTYRDKFSPGSGYVPLGPIRGGLLGVKLNDKVSVVKPIDHTFFGRKKLDNNHFFKAKMIEFFNPESTEPTQILDYPKNSIYRNNKTFYPAHIPHLSVNQTNQLLYLALPLEHKVYVFDPNNNFELRETINLKLEGFKTPEGLPFEDQHKNRQYSYSPTSKRIYVLGITNSIILEIHVEGVTMIVVHKTGTSHSNFPDTKTASAAAKRQNKYFTSFVKNGEVVLRVEQRFKQLVHLDENRFITPYMSSEDEELDYNKFYIYELQKIN